MKQKVTVVIMVIIVCSGWCMLYASQPQRALQPGEPAVLPTITQNVPSQTPLPQITAAPQNNMTQQKSHEGTLMKPGQVMKDIGGEGVVPSESSQEGTFIDVLR